MLSGLGMRLLNQSRPKLAWGVWLFGLAALALLVQLGLWQLQRADEKRELLAQQTRAQTSIEYLSHSDPEPLAPVSLPGQFLQTPVFLLDNQIYKGKAGYEVLMVLQQDMDTRGILVNLGWIAAGADRRQLPDIAVPDEPVRIEGRLTPITKGLTLSDDNWSASWPKRIQQIDLPQMEKLLGIPLYPWHVRLDTPLLETLVLDWQVVNMPPEKHQAYALQWFSLALALAVWLFWFFRLRSTDED